MKEQPDQVYLCAAKVGGIHANNTLPAEFIYENMMIEANVIHEAWRSGIKKLLFLGSSCIYPRNTQQPIKESDLLTGPLEKTNEPYAIAKIAGIKLCESYNRQYKVDFRSVMPTNLYGKGDNYHSKNSHVIPGLIRRFHEAKISRDKEVEIWGTGEPLRDFLYVDDMALASCHVMNLDPEAYRKNTGCMESHINVGSGEDVQIKDLAKNIASIVSFKGQIRFNSTMPDGTPRKLLDISTINSLGWQPKVGLIEGLTRTYKDFLESQDSIRMD